MAPKRDPNTGPMDGEQLRELLATAEITQREFAELLGTSRRNVVHWLANGPNGPVEKIGRLLRDQPALIEVLRRFAAEDAAMPKRGRR